MNYINKFDNGKVKICKEDLCIETNGNNGKLIVMAASILSIAFSLYYISKIKF